jgi:hypothetical protein
VLIIWDRLFGTFSPEIEAEPVRYGLTNNIATHHPVKVAFGEYSDIDKICDAPGVGKTRLGTYFWPQAGAMTARTSARILCAERLLNLPGRTPTTVETKRHAVVKAHRGDWPIRYCHGVQHHQ